MEITFLKLPIAGPLTAAMSGLGKAMQAVIKWLISCSASLEPASASAPDKGGWAVL